jgi:hypothetical protein
MEKNRGAHLRDELDEVTETSFYEEQIKNRGLPDNIKNHK